jgi:hypothetical protein
MPGVVSFAPGFVAGMAFPEPERLAFVSVPFAPGVSA